MKIRTMALITAAVAVMLAVGAIGASVCIGFWSLLLPAGIFSGMLKIGSSFVCMGLGGLTAAKSIDLLPRSWQF